MAKLLVALVLYASWAKASAESVHFQEWYPQWGLQNVLIDHCNESYQGYVNNNSPACVNEYSSHRNNSECRARLVTDCLLENLPESWKADMAAAAVLLGLLPTILSLIGSNVVETSLLSFRRPLLALLLSFGSPAVYPIRTFDYTNLAELSRPRIGPGVRIRSNSSRIAVLASQYLLALIAIVNLLHVSLELGIKTVCSFDTENQYYPLGWALISLPIHVISSWATWLRMRFQKGGRGKHGSFGQRLADEFTLSAQQRPSTLEFRDESPTFVALSWLSSTAIITQILYGTVVFSSILFLGTAVVGRIIPRYWLSAVLCRAVLMFEIAGIRSTVDVQDEQKVSRIDSAADLSNAY
ncbi:hypothetical protein F5X98DRAFT_371766 [Xylaria grammica]|nr:hypothetical protein F5X98DRAFT_371766 [Xylaria grammica]